MPAILNTHGCNCRIQSSHSALPAHAILAAIQPVQPSSGRWLRWLCPGHPPGRMMAVIQPSQPFGRRMAVANSTQPSRRPDTSPGGSTLAPRATTPLFWMAGVVISQPSRWNAWSGYSKLSHPPADGCVGCMPVIMRPGGWLGHTAIAAIGRRMAALTGTQPEWRVLGGGVARML